jgi:hypothetical protein
MNQSEETSVDQIRQNLRSDCGKCFGFCCTALCFAKTDGFPVDKPEGEPCPKLQMDFKCRVYGDLKKLGYKGCTGYDCFGAGQRVAKVTYGGNDWRRKPDSKEQMLRVFGVMQELHEMLWYLAEACTLLAGTPSQAEAEVLLQGLEIVAQLGPEQLLDLNLDAYRSKASAHIKKAGEEAQKRVPGGLNLYPVQRKAPKRRLNLMGADLQKNDLTGADLRGAYLIAANLQETDLSYADLLGADLRDTDICGANLQKSIFLTQMQVNTAKGDAHTKLPSWLQRPEHWER